MTFPDLIGTLGVGLILLAYFLNVSKLIQPQGKLFFVLNIIGAAFACYASLLISFWPFVFLEGIWILVSIYGLMKIMKIKIS